MFNTSAWQTKVDEFADLAWISAGFRELSRSRSQAGLSGSLPGIAPSEVVAWCDLRGIRGHAREMFASCVSALDEALLGWVAKQKKARDGA